MGAQRGRAALPGALFVAALTAWPLAAQDEHTTIPGRLEGRPGEGAASPLQRRIDRAEAGDTVVVEAGTYAGDLVIDKPLRLVGQGRPLLQGSGSGSVVRIRANDVTIEGFDIDGREGGDVAQDTSAIHIAGERAVVRACHISRSIFGVYLRSAHGTVVEGSTIRGIPGRDAGEKGSGIHVWSTEGFRFEGNEIADVRDGFYIQSSGKGTIRGNVAKDLRYGLHYMFSDDNVFEDNTFENGAAGTALMYSRRIAFRRNRLVRNRGFASVGLLFKTCDDVLAEDNLIADNARGIFLEGSARNVFRRNVVAASDAAVILYDSSEGNRFEENSFVGNLSPLNLVGRRTDTVFLGNYYSDNQEPDLDGDGRSDRPYRLSSVFDHFRGNLTAADLFSRSFAAKAMGSAEETFPVLRLVPVEDLRPRVRPPSLPAVPTFDLDRRRVNLLGLLGSTVAVALGAASLSRARLRPRKEANG